MDGNRGIMLMFDDNGVAHQYDDTWDITIHCETEEEHNRALELLERVSKELNKKGVE